MNHESWQDEKFSKITIVCDIVCLVEVQTVKYVQDSYEEMPWVCAQKKYVLFPKQ